MSERFDAPRSGGRETAAGGTGARGTRRSDAGRSDAGRSETRRSGSGRSETGRSESGRSDTRRSGMRSDGGNTGSRGSNSGRGSSGRGRGGRNVAAPAEGTAALALEVTGLEVTAAEPVTAGRPRLWVAPPLPIRAPRATFAASVIGLVLIGVLGILLVNTKTMEQSFRIDALQKEQAELDKQQQTLEQQLIEASNPGNIHAAARRLGLVMAESPAMIRLPDGKISRIPTPGRGHPGVTAQSGLQAGTQSAGTGQ